MKKLLDSTFDSLDSYARGARDIINRLSVHKNKNRIKEAITLCKDYLTDSSHPPIYKICTVRFLKDLFDEAIFYVIQLIQENILPLLQEVILYREDVKSIRRGSTFLLSHLEEHLKGQDIIEMMSRYVKPSQSYFEIVHECVFFWSKYIQEEKSPFKTAYQNVRHCTFPTTIKHFNDKQIDQFRVKYNMEMNAVEYQLEDCFKKWEQTKDKLQSMEKKDFVRENLEGIYDRISEYVTEYTNLLVDLKNSYYYQRQGLRERMLALLVEKKEFLKIYIECANRNSFLKLYEKYGKYEETIIDEEFGIDKRKKKKRVVTGEDKRLTDIKRIYLADFPAVLGKLDAIPIALERNKNYIEYKYSQSRVQNNSRILQQHPGQEFQVKVNSPHQPSQRTQVDQSSSQRLKSSFVSNGLAILNTPEQNKHTPFVILPSQSESFGTPSKKIKNSPSEARKTDTYQGRNSLNSVVYRQELLKQQRRVNASVGVLPSRWKQVDMKVKSVSKNLLKPKT